MARCSNCKSLTSPGSLIHHTISDDFGIALCERCEEKLNQMWGTPL